jgi:hypothetical protein
MSGQKLALVALVALLCAVVPAQAQDTSLTPEDEELVAFVAEAMINLAAVQGYSVNATQERVTTMSAEIDDGSATIQLETTLEIEGQVAFEEGSLAAGEWTIGMELNSSTPNQPDDAGAATAHMVWVDRNVWLRFTDTSGGLEGSELEEWTNITTIIQKPESADLYNWRELVDNNDLPMRFAVSADTVQSIAELDGEAIDGEDMRVFEIEFDLTALMAQEDFAITNIINSNALKRVRDEALIQQILEGSFLKVTMWISAENPILHRIDVETILVGEMPASVTGGDFPIDLEVSETASTTLSNLDKPVEIVTPED